jgi:hypothetical protein
MEGLETALEGTWPEPLGRVEQDVAKPSRPPHQDPVARLGTAPKCEAIAVVQTRGF